MEQERQLILDLINFAWQNKGVELDRFQIQLFAILQPTALRMQYNLYSDPCSKTYW